jgi:hypothetical protein
MQTGDPGLGGSSIAAGRDYVIVNSFPDGDTLEVRIYSQSGQLILFDEGDNLNLASGRVSPNGKFYYSCTQTPISVRPATTANIVRVYDLSEPIASTSLAQPLATSTDPIFIASVCGPPTKYIN